MLRFAEDLLLLALDDDSGRLHTLPPQSLELALAGAFIFELAFKKRIDSDLSGLRVHDWSPTGDPLLDRVLAALHSSRTSLTLQQSLAKVALITADLIPALFRSLEEKGILEHREKRFLWKVQEVTHPAKDRTEDNAIRARIRDIVLQDQVPDPQEIVLVALMETCELDRIIFTPEELKKHQARIQQLARMESLGAAMLNALEKIKNASVDKSADGPGKR